MIRSCDQEGESASSGLQQLLREFPALTIKIIFAGVISLEEAITADSIAEVVGAFNKGVIKSQDFSPGLPQSNFNGESRKQPS